MSQLKVSVRKLTDKELMQEACESTFLGKSHASLLTIYKSEHSPARTQLFWVKFQDIKLFVATHFIRHHVGVVPFQLSCREDRNGNNINFQERITRIQEQVNNLSIIHNTGYKSNSFDAEICDVDMSLEWLKDNADRNTLVNLSLLINAQSLIDMAKLRLCAQAHKETRQAFEALKREIFKIDPDLANLLVKKCVYRNGLCGEPHCCGYNGTEAFKAELGNYVSNFSEKQAACIKPQNNEDK